MFCHSLFVVINVFLRSYFAHLSNHSTQGNSILKRRPSSFLVIGFFINSNGTFQNWVQASYKPISLLFTELKAATCRIYGTEKVTCVCFGDTWWFLMVVLHVTVANLCWVLGQQLSADFSMLSNTSMFLTEQLTSCCASSWDSICLYFFSLKLDTFSRNSTLRIQEKSRWMN